MPARYGRVAKALRRLGVSIHKRHGKGSHVVLDDGRGNPYPLPLTNGDRTELTNAYLHGLCRAFDLDFDELMRSL